jgi:hypothetical protein
MIEPLHVTVSELERDPRRVLEAVRRGQLALVETAGRPEAAILDIADLRLLRAALRYYANPSEQDLSGEPTGERFAGLDEQARYDLVIAYYLAEEMSLGRVAELLGLPWIVLRERCARLGLPLRLGPRTAQEALAEARAAADFEPDR